MDCFLVVIMVFLKSLLVVLAVSTSTFASPATPKCSVTQKLSAPPSGWVLDDGNKINKEKGSIKLRIGLVPENMDKFHDMAMRVCQFFPSVLIFDVQNFIIEALKTRKTNFNSDRNPRRQNVRRTSRSTCHR